jgi:hypothetical protein
MTDKPKRRGTKPKDPTNIKSITDKIKADTDPQPKVPKEVLEDDVSRAKLDKYEELTNKRTFCKVCLKYRKHVPVACNRFKDVYYCVRENGYEGHLRQNRKPVSEQQRLCKYCNREFKEARARCAHEISCKSNPKHVERNQKISDSHKGLVQTTETKVKIASSMREYHALRIREGIYSTRTVRVDKDRKITIKIF